MAMLSHINSQVEQNRKDNIAFILDRQYHCLRKNVPSDSKELFGDVVTKRMTTITNNQKLFQTTSKNYNSSRKKNSKTLRRFPKTTANQSQYGYQNKNTSQ